MTTEPTGTVVHATSRDSFRIEVLGENRSVQMPASLLLAMDTVMRYCAMEKADLRIDRECGLDAVWIARAWNPIAETPFGFGNSPWTALIALAAKIEAGRAND